MFGANSGNWLSDPTGLFYDPECSDIGITTHTDLMNNLYFVIFLITQSRCNRLANNLIAGKGAWKKCSHLVNINFTGKRRFAPVILIYSIARYT